MAVSSAENSARMLQHAIIKLCNEHIAFSTKLQILGVITLTIDDGEDELVVKVNNTLKRVQPLPKKTDNVTESVSTDNTTGHVSADTCNADISQLKTVNSKQSEDLRQSDPNLGTPKHDSNSTSCVKPTMEDEAAEAPMQNVSSAMDTDEVDGQSTADTTKPCQNNQSQGIKVKKRTRRKQKKKTQPKTSSVVSDGTNDKCDDQSEHIKSEQPNVTHVSGDSHDAGEDFQNTYDTSEKLDDVT